MDTGWLDVQMSKCFDRLADSLDTKLLIANVAGDGEAAATLFFDQPNRFLGVFVLLEIDNRGMSSFFGKGDRYRAANSAVAAGYQGDFAVEPAGAAP